MCLFFMLKPNPLMLKLLSSNLGRNLKARPSTSHSSFPHCDAAKTFPDTHTHKANGTNSVTVTLSRPSDPTVQRGDIQDTAAFFLGQRS